MNFQPRPIRYRRLKMLRKDILLGLSRIPPFPPIAARLLALLSDDSVPIGDVAELVGSDPTYSARLLQCVNSVEFGFPSPVVEVMHALSLLGLDRTREVTVTLATATYATGALRTNELRRCWEHTVATAILADEIARACGAFVSHAYTAGIMHDIGRLGLLVAYPRDYERIIRDAADRCLDLLDFEREIFGMHHAEAGRLLSERWNLPEEFRIVAGRHHDPCEGEELDLLRIVHVACRLADVLGYDITRPLVPLDVDTVLSEMPKRIRERLKTTPEELRDRIEQRIRAYDGADVDVPAAPAEPEPESATPPDTEEQLTSDAGSKAGSRSLYVAAAIVMVLVTCSAIVFWR
jgi:HD-like signal output (HDOD) protein